MKGFIEVENTGGARATVAIDSIAVVFDGNPCEILLKNVEALWQIRQTYEEVLCLIAKAQKEGGE